MPFCSAVPALVFSLAISVVAVARAGQDETCTMDDQEHKANYHCPNDYEVIYIGEGKKICDGKCFKKGDKKSLREAVGDLLQRQGLPLPATDFDSAIDQLTSTGKTSIPTSKGPVIFLAPRRER